jgi:hypothetical protein
MKHSDFELYEAVILSGQMPQERVPGFLEENPEFEKWYREKLLRDDAKLIAGAGVAVGPGAGPIAVKVDAPVR